jgi:glycosyltransferase involved in cell wall biosynthesis
MRSTRLVWSIRSSRVDWSKYGWLQKTSYQIERLLSSVPDLIIANSIAGRDFAVLKGFPGTKILVVHNGVDVERFRPDEAVRQSQRKAWNLRQSDIAIGVLGRLDPMKGHHTFLMAAAQVSRKLPNVRFFCIGEGSELASLQELAGELGMSDQIQFVGQSDDPVSALNGLDMFCSTSYFGEGFSNAIAEAMACGLPCIVTSVGDSALIVGDFGVVLPPRDPDALGSAIMACASELHAHPAAGARRRIVDNFGLDSMVDRTIALLEPLRSSATHQNG